MQDEFDFTEPDDLEENTALEQQRARNRWGIMIAWEVGIACVLYLGAKLSNWLIGFPASLKDAGRTISVMFISLFGMSILSMVGAFTDSVIKEFRIRSRQTNRRIDEIKAQIESIEDQISR
jgi:hypothetical protein